MKDFDNWNNEKKKIEINKKNCLIIHEREIWWCSLGVNLGDEEDGKNNIYERPILILKKFNRKVFLGVPLSTKLGNPKYYCPIDYSGKKSNVIISQIRLLSVKRLRRIIGILEFNQFKNIKNLIINFLN